MFDVGRRETGVRSVSRLPFILKPNLEYQPDKKRAGGLRLLTKLKVLCQKKKLKTKLVSAADCCPSTVD
jgi:hypothetical protein